MSSCGRLPKGTLPRRYDMGMLCRVICVDIETSRRREDLLSVFLDLVEDGMVSA